MIGSNGPLVEIKEGNKGEAISSRGGFASLYKSGSMRSFLDTEVNRERGTVGGRRGGHQNPKLAPWDKVQSWPKFGRLKRAGILK
jgi:hypothetical protein